jgi:NADPH-dependent 2,4-dienoyl-CoA reductase/sulfur reductase-like enzyme/nitrite reductase/ring-hydroxylating ferredoxin subunit
MGTPPQADSGPDLTQGVPEHDVREGVPLLGHVGDDPVIIVRDRGRLRAVGAKCTHYGGPLADGVIDDGAIHCPWHHACFDLATGRARGPALDAIACFDVTLEGGRIRVGAKRAAVRGDDATEPKRVVIVGAGAAGIACAEALRAEGHRGAITLVSAEGSDPVDRPNLSKDFLAGNAPEEWVFLRTADALAARDITIVAEPAITIERRAGRDIVRTKSGRELAWDALLVATGSEPIRLPIDGADLPHVHLLRSLADSRAIIAAASADKPVVVIGGSFIGLEVAASLRARGAAVTVVAPDPVPLARVLGDEVGRFVRGVHEAKGVAFRLGRKPARIARDAVTLDDGSALPAALVVMGVGVSPRVELAAAAGLTIDRGVVVDAELRAAPGVWAAGDIARFPWRGELVRIEHWQVAVRHGQAVARAMLGRGGAARNVPFFWSQHHDVTIGYVGHAERFDRADVHGDLAGGDAHVAYWNGARVDAVATLGRDRLSLEIAAAMARGDDLAVKALVG